VKVADRAGDFFFVTLLVLGGVTVALHVAGLGWLREQFWGTHLYSFLPAPALPIAGAALAAVAVLAAMRHSGDRVVVGPGKRAADARLAAPAAPAAGTPRSTSGPLQALLLGAGSSLIFWLLRIRHLILGDAHTLAENLPRGQGFHPDSPLSMVFHQALYRAAGRLFRHGETPPVEVATNTTALGSVLCGGVFALVAWALAGEMLSAREPDGTGEPPDPALRRLLFLCLMTQGYVLLFCGYVELYSYAALALALYLLFALRYLERRSALFWPGVFLLIGVALHLAAAILAPSFLVLVVAGLRRPGRRLGAARDLALLSAVAVGLAALLRRLGHGYDVLAQLLRMGRAAQAGEIEQQRVSLFSPAHLRDFLNEQVLIGPLALLLALAALALALRTRRLRDEKLLVLLVAAGVSAIVSFAVRDLRLGYARDWDLFAMFGIAFAVFGFYGMVSGARAARALRWNLALALAVSLFHTAAWVGVNASYERSFERLKTLPLGLGRTEAMVGYWYGLKGDHEAAHRWLKLATDHYPTNTAAYLMDGTFRMDEGRFMDAAKDFWFATRNRPSFPLYRVWLVDALMRAARPGLALEEATVLVGKWPDDPQGQAMYGVALLGAGRKEEARRALRRAVELAPGVEAYREALRNVDLEGGYEQTLRELWDRISYTET
jgi:tetratricopeptide (TPR) repeat protein